MARLASSSLATSAPPIKRQGHPGGAQTVFEFAARFLPGADDHVIDRQALRLAIDDDVQAGVVDALVSSPRRTSVRRVS
jgi:type III secretory pathway component EscV